jgi:NAD(P)-dependent dehydrogenase (short-subunit alcohol dehydrogenase family)
VSSTAQGLDSVQQELAQAGLQADVLEADVSSAADVQRVVAHTLSRHGAIHGLVNNAAIGPLGTVLTTEEAVFEKIFDVNVKGTYLMSRAVIPHMAQAGGGAIVNIGSGAGYGKPNMAAYASSKGAIVALSMAMAYDHFHDHVRVNVAIPGGGGIVSGMSVGRFGGDVGCLHAQARAGHRRRPPGHRARPGQRRGLPPVRRSRHDLGHRDRRGLLRAPGRAHPGPALRPFQEKTTCLTPLKPPPQPPAPAAPRLARDARYYDTKREIEEFLYDEANLLDERRLPGNGWTRWPKTCATSCPWNTT